MNNIAYIPTKGSYIFNRGNIISQLKGKDLKRNTLFIKINDEIIVVERSQIEDIEFEEL